MHTRAPAQVLPTQHGWPDIPQVGADWQVPPMQIREPVQVLPVQQLWPAAPHMGGGLPQLPAVHTRPMLQSDPMQQS